MITGVLAQSESPGNEQRDFWSSKAADTPGSRNYSGIKNPVIDTLVERVIFATDRDDLSGRDPCARSGAAVELLRRAATDRAMSTFTPTGTSSASRRSSRPISVPTPNSWWIDPEKEAALAAKYGFAN